jgi:L-lactate dehydrogenase (cytochrome)
MAVRPGWCWDVGVRGRPHTLGNLAATVGAGVGLDAYWAWVGRNFDPRVTWDDLADLRDRWRGPLVLKGVLDPEDARRAVALGVDGIVVSNHGGRQLDGTLSTIAALPAIAAAVGGRTKLLLDGGVRSGLDVLKALALGADMVLLGRAAAWALAARGEAGVARMLGLIGAELRAAMAMTGCLATRDAGAELLVQAGESRGLAQPVAPPMSLAEQQPYGRR